MRWGPNIEKGKQLYFAIIEGQEVPPKFPFLLLKKKKIPKFCLPDKPSFNLSLNVFSGIICNGYTVCLCMNAL